MAQACFQKTLLLLLHGTLVKQVHFYVQKGLLNIMAPIYIGSAAG